MGLLPAPSVAVVALCLAVPARAVFPACFQLTLTVYQGHPSDPDKVIRRLSGDRPALFSPETVDTVPIALPALVLLIYNNTVSLVLRERTESPKAIPSVVGEEEKNCCSPVDEGGKPRRLRVRYFAVPLSTMPPEIRSGQSGGENPDEAEDATGARHNCSPPHVVPEAFKCDLAWQCAGGEDETAFWCDYTSLCGRGRFFTESQCRKLIFPSEPISPEQAMRNCARDHELVTGTTSLSNDPYLAAFYARVLSLSGFDSMVLEVTRARAVEQGLQHLYRFLWQWKGDVPSVIYNQPVHRGRDPTLACAVFRRSPRPHIQAVSCTEKGMYASMCAVRLIYLDTQPLSVVLPQANHNPDKFPAKFCLDGSFTHEFLPCSAQDFMSETNAKAVDSTLPRFECKNGVRVHYSLACDGVDDCGDESDESGCFVEDTGYLRERIMFTCTRVPEFIPNTQRCNAVPDCHDGTDEVDCLFCETGTSYCDGLGCLPDRYVALGLCPSQEMNVSRRPSQTPPGHHVTIDLDGYGMAQLQTEADRDKPCSHTHVACGPGMCIPLYTVNNGQLDCPLPYNEEGITFECPGYYRCYKHPKICLHDDHLCDGIYQCPLKDDERFCHLTAPPGCSREGHAVTCTQAFHAVFRANHTRIRYLDMSRVPLTKDWLLAEDVPLYLSYDLPELIIFLNLSSCGLKEIGFTPFSKVTVLDLSYNKLTSVTMGDLGSLSYLSHLNLSHNFLFSSQEPDLRFLLQGNARLHRLMSLTLVGTGIQFITRGAFSNTSRLKYLDLRENAMTGYQRHMFEGSAALRELYADDQTLCCTFFTLYSRADATCEAPRDELSSCEDLLRTDFFRGFLWTLATLTLFGNAWVLIYRLFMANKGTSPVFRVLVANLCVSDFLMGIYLSVIGCADAAYKGYYVWRQERWRESGACQTAGFLCLLSSEVSAFIICLITLDRFLVLRFPFSRHLHLSAKTSALAACCAWLLGGLLAAVPLLPPAAHWRFYSQTGICLALPTTRRHFPGHSYAFGVLIGLNLVLFVMIGVGQVLLYLTVRSSALTAQTQRTEQELAIARRLFLVVFTDFCCWFPISLMGVLAARGTPIPGEVHVWAAIFVLPLNSALNPFLYTLHTVLERRRRRRQRARVQLVLSRLDVEANSWPQDQLQDLLHCIQRILRRHKREQPPGQAVAS